MAFGIGEAVSAVIIGNMVCRPILSEIQKREQQFLQLLGGAQTSAALNLSQALGKLAAQGMNNGIDSHQLFRNLEKLLRLLCLNACHRRVWTDLGHLCWKLINEQTRALTKAKFHIYGTDVDKIRMLLLWDPDVHEVFEATKTDAEQVYPLPHKKWGPETLERIRSNPTFLRIGDTYKEPLDFQQFHEDVRSSVEGIFDRAKKIHETQRALADALSRQNALLQSFDLTDEGKAHRKAEEANKLRRKLQSLASSDVYVSPDDIRASRLFPKRGTVSDIAVMAVNPGGDLEHRPRQKSRLRKDSIQKYRFNDRWECAQLRLALLAGRIEAREARIQRRKDIDALFDAIGATDDERGEIESHINSLYGVIYQRWSKDGWIKHRNKGFVFSMPNWDNWADRGFMKPINEGHAFSDTRFRGWKPKSKRHRLFLNHYAEFQFISPRQLTENGVLAAVQTMESQEDAVFTRTSRLNRELQDIFDRVCENENHGKFDEAIADLNILLHRLSETSGPNAVDYPPEIVSAIHSYLAYCYAFRGEHLEKAVQSAKEAMRIQNTFLALLILGWCYQQQGKVPEAIEALEAAKEPTMQAGSALLPLLHRVLGDAYRDAEQHQQAEQEWQAGWERAEDPEWKAQDGLTAFERTERAVLRTELAQRLRKPEQENAS